MIETDREQLMRLADVPEFVESHTGRSVSLNTIYRWIRVGLVGVRLETCYVGGTQMTSVEALARFDHAVTQNKLRPQRDSSPPTKKQVTHASDRLRKRLGILGE